MECREIDSPKYSQMIFDNGLKIDFSTTAAGATEHPHSNNNKK